MEANAEDLQGIGRRWDTAMRRGDFEAAWRETDRIELPRREADSAGTFTWSPQFLTWNGSSFDRNDVIVWCSHGLGDTLQFVRYVPLLRRRARNLTLMVQPPLLTLFRGASEFGNVLNAWSDEPPRHDVAIEVMELAYAFRSTVDTLPRDVPYLPVGPIERAASRLPPLDNQAGLRIGLLWAASDWDMSRSISIADLEPLRKLRNVRFYSLQQGSQSEEWRDAPIPITPLSPHTQEIVAAAAAMRSLDLVITVDGMAAHLAGALGRPVCVLLKQQADWRWMDARPDTPWYPTMRLLRQRVDGDWRGLVADAADLIAGGEWIRRR